MGGSLSLKKVGGYWWPESDAQCAPAILTEVKWIEKHWLPFVKGRSVAVQAGGNCGVYPSVLIQFFGSVYTAEPDAENFACLALNCPHPSVYAFRCAFGDRHEQVGLTKVPANVGAHYVDRSTGGIPVLCIDDLSLPACDLIALDVEGYELLALKGAEGTIRKFSPTIIYENKGHGARYHIAQADTVQWLTNHGYEHKGVVGRDHIWVR